MRECDHAMRQIWPKRTADGGSIGISERQSCSNIIMLTLQGHEDTLGEGDGLKKPLIFIGWSALILFV